MSAEHIANQGEDQEKVQGITITLLGYDELLSVFTLPTAKKLGATDEEHARSQNDLNDLKRRRADALIKYFNILLSNNSFPDISNLQAAMRTNSWVNYCNENQIPLTTSISLIRVDMGRKQIFFENPETRKKLIIAKYK